MRALNTLRQAQKWRCATVVEVRENEVKVAYDDPWEARMHDEWLSKTSERLSHAVVHRSSGPDQVRFLPQYHNNAHMNSLVFEFSFNIRSGDAKLTLTNLYMGIPSSRESLVASIMNRGEVLAFLR
jgi:hypothetical protein